MNDDRTNGRKRGVTVGLLNMKELDETIMMSHAVAVGRDGEIYILCSEGVGWKVKESTFTFNDYDRNDIPLLTIMQHVTGEMDLADFVRSFGDRLECNFALWYATLVTDKP